MPTKNAKRSTSFIRLLLAGRCSQRHPCTGAQNGANSPLGFRLQTRPKRRKSHPGARRRRGPLALSLAGRSTMVYRKGQPRRKGTGVHLMANQLMANHKSAKPAPMPRYNREMSVRLIALDIDGTLL